MDGAVAQMTLNGAKAKKIDVVTVHDAVGTHLHDVEVAAKVFRQSLADVYRAWKPPFVDAEEFRYLMDPELVQFLRDVHDSEVLIT
jgi:DNA-directed RNA polymerase